MSRMKLLHCDTLHAEQEHSQKHDSLYTHAYEVGEESEVRSMKLP